MIIFVSLAAPRVPVRVTLSRRDSDDISEKDLSQFLTIKVSVLSSPAGSGGVCCLELQASMQDNCSIKHKNNQNRFLRDIFIVLSSSYPLYVEYHYYSRHNHHFVSV